MLIKSCADRRLAVLVGDHCVPLDSAEDAVGRQLGDECQSVVRNFQGRDRLREDGRDADEGRVGTTGERLVLDHDKQGPAVIWAPVVGVGLAHSGGDQAGREPVQPVQGHVGLSQFGDRVEVAWCLHHPAGVEQVTSDVAGGLFRPHWWL